MDGHDREDVVEYRGMFLMKLNALVSTHQPPPLPEDNLQRLCSIGNPSAQRKLALMFYDETVFNANRTITLDREWTHEVETEGPGHGIMISNFTDEHDGFLKLRFSEVE